MSILKKILGGLVALMILMSGALPMQLCLLLMMFSMLRKWNCHLQAE